MNPKLEKLDAYEKFVDEHYKFLVYVASCRRAFAAMGKTVESFSERIRACFKDKDDEIPWWDGGYNDTIQIKA